MVQVVKPSHQSTWRWASPTHGWCSQCPHMPTASCSKRGTSTAIWTKKEQSNSRSQKLSHFWVKLPYDKYSLTAASPISLFLYRYWSILSWQPSLKINLDSSIFQIQVSIWRRHFYRRHHNFFHEAGESREEKEERGLGRVWQAFWIIL